MKGGSHLHAARIWPRRLAQALGGSERRQAAGQSTTVKLGPGPLANRTDVFRITAPPPTRRLVVSDADTDGKRVLANLQFPSEFKVLGLKLVPSESRDMETLPAGTLPLTIELTSSLPGPRQAGILILGVIEMETSEMDRFRRLGRPRIRSPRMNLTPAATKQ